MPEAPTGPFGTVFGESFSVANWIDGEWETPRLGPIQAFSFHPATHVLHYGSACFEGLKAHRGDDNVVRIFRLHRHVERMQASAKVLRLPVPDADMLARMIIDVVSDNLHLVPAAPGSLYLRPTLIGTEPNIGAAAAPSRSALLYVLPSPVGDYFKGGIRPLKVKVETAQPRSTPAFGSVKTGANYAMALGITLDAKEELGIDQVLFAPNGDVQETGASNFLLLRDNHILTKALDSSFLHGVTRDSILTLARESGYEVEERDFSVTEMIEWAEEGEAALSGTAAVLGGVGSMVVDGEEIPFGSGEVGATTLELRQSLTDVQLGRSPDNHGWTTIVES
ncbi:MAG: branched-chain-amino-acid transaminase [Acidimicrobiia bacterium]|nr:branched-chain-amino-acid transaminase [Acidimicrobiia bacterium]